MFFQLSKLLDLFFSPFCVSLLCALVAAYFARRGQARRAWSLGAIAFLLSYLFATPFVAAELSAYAERHDGTPFRPQQKYDAVIVLGGFMSLEDNGRFALSESGERVIRAYELLRIGQARLGIISAGGTRGMVEADVAAEFLRQLGIDRERLLLGRSSVNTRQNAQEVADIVRANKLERLLLVTSAAHMQRALECMRAVGLEPDVLPCDYRRVAYGRQLWSLLYPRASFLSTSEQVLRELFGRVVYRVMGYAKA